MSKQQIKKQVNQVKTINHKDWLESRFKANHGEALEHLNAMLGAPDEPELFLRSLGDVAKAWGVAQISEVSGLNRENLYDMLSEKGNPRFSSLLKVLDAMGLRMVVEKKDEHG